MRQLLIEALAYPQQLVLKFTDQHDCPLDSLFDATSERCQQCDLNQECHWVNCLDDFSNFRGKPAHTINASLLYGLKLVKSIHSERQHQSATCACETCTWIRSAQQLTERFETQLQPNRYRHKMKTN